MLLLLLFGFMYTIATRVPVCHRACECHPPHATHQIGCDDDTMSGDGGGGGGADFSMGSASSDANVHLDMNESSWDRIVRTGDA